MKCGEEQGDVKPLPGSLGFELTFQYRDITMAGGSPRDIPYAIVVTKQLSLEVRLDYCEIGGKYMHGSQKLYEYISSAGYYLDVDADDLCSYGGAKNHKLIKTVDPKAKELLIDTLADYCYQQRLDGKRLHQLAVGGEKNIRANGLK
ncbi:hypothetical protein HY404_02960 [Candidatus Microgenomates bacterium]|nr:hypothetical protein [Candidatus Microgenomates bacterium]